jgi:hypothetical protein
MKRAPLKTRSPSELKGNARAKSATAPRQSGASHGRKPRHRRGGGFAVGGSGVAVLVNYYQNRQAAEAVGRRIEAAGGRALGWQADVTRQDEMEQMVRAAERELGPVDVLVNNAYFPLQVGPPRRR